MTVATRSLSFEYNMMIMMMMTMVANGYDDEDKDLFHNIYYTDDDDDDDLYGNLHMRFTILYNPIHMGI